MGGFGKLVLFSGGVNPELREERAVVRSVRLGERYLALCTQNAARCTQYENMLTRILKINPTEPEEKKIEKAARVIREGGIVVFPTETVYGLGANLLNKGAVERIYKVKERPENKPLTIHVASADTIKEMECYVSSAASRLIKRFWPGPLTLILESKQGGKTGFRMPKNKIALQLIKEAGVPVVAPSANHSGSAAPHSPEDVIREFNGLIELIIDAGKTEIGIESTVVDLAVSPYRILREGAIPVKTIQEAIDRNL